MAENQPKIIDGTGVIKSDRASIVPFVPSSQTFADDAFSLANGVDILISNGFRVTDRLTLFLLGRGLELAFKAFLMHHNFSADELRKKKFGHKLANLMEASTDAGLKITSDEQDHIRSFNETYVRKHFEYMEYHGSAFSNPHLLRGILKEILYQVATEVYGTTTKANGRPIAGLNVAADWQDSLNMPKSN